MPPQIIQQAAEAIIIKDNDNIIKRRIAKGYRIKEIDEKLRLRRTRSEAKIMEKIQEKINVPKIIKVDEKSKEIIMEFIDGLKLSDNLDSLNNSEQVCQELGKNIAKMHDLNIIHGDLTTSNMILVKNPHHENNKTNKNNENSPLQIADNLTINKNKKYNSVMPEQEDGMEEAKLIKTDKPNTKDNQVFLIDFGLSFHSSKIEDKAVDLHLLKQALESRHFQHWQVLFGAFLTGYNPNDKIQILKQLEKVELRGRYKH